MSGVSLPPDTTVGPRPLLSVSVYGTGVLSTMAGDVIELAPFGGFGWLNRDNSSVTVWQPIEPLPAGEYLWDSGYGPRSLFVDPDLLPEPLPTLSDGALEVVLEEATSGCGDSCGSFDPSGISISFSSNTDDFVIVLHVTVGGDRQSVVWGHTGREGSISLSRVHFRDDIRTQPVCVSIAAFSNDGVGGNRLDLGCSDPDTGERIDDRRGCATAQTTDALALLLGLVVVVRRRVGAPA